VPLSNGTSLFIRDITKVNHIYVERRSAEDAKENIFHRTQFTVYVVFSKEPRDYMSVDLADESEVERVSKALESAVNVGKECFYGITEDCSGDD
jgi:hypothetical protein